MAERKHYPLTPQARQSIREWQLQNPEKQKAYLDAFYARNGGRANYLREWRAKHAQPSTKDRFDRNPDFDDKAEEEMNERKYEHGIDNQT